MKLKIRPFFIVDGVQGMKPGSLKETGFYFLQLKF
jgi:hypothetical protein